METQSPPLLTRSVAKRLDLSEDRVRQLANSGALPSTRTETGVRLFSAEAVEQFIERRQQAGRRAAQR